MGTNDVTVYNAEEDFKYMRPSDIITPRLALQQFLSPGVTSGDYVAGSFVLVDEKRIAIPFGKKGLFVPLFFWMNWIEWNTDRDAPKDKRIIDSSFDPQSNLCKRAERFDEVQTTEGPRIAVTEYYNWISALIPTDDSGAAVWDFDDMAIISFSRAAHKRGKELLNRLYKVKFNGARCPFFHHAFELSAEFRDEGAKKKYMAPNVGKMLDTPNEHWTMLGERATFLRNNRTQIMERELEKEKNEGAPSEPASPAQTQANTDNI